MARNYVISGVRGESFNVPVYRQRSEQHDLRKDLVVDRESKRRSSGESWEVGGELSYDLAKKHFVSLKVVGGEDWKRNETSAWETKSTENEWLFAGTKARSSRSQISASANYQWDIKPNGTTLNVVGQYTQKPQRLRNGAREAEEDAYLSSSVTEDGERQWTLQAHYVNSLSPKFNLQVGGSYIYRDYDSKHILEGQGEGEPQALMRATLQFYSSYVKWAYRTKIFRLDIGAKFDYLNDGKGVYRKEQGFEQWVTETPFHCLPNAELSFFFPKKKLSRLGLGYAMTKNRPGLAFLSTRTDESNADYIRQNNVSLKSETMHRLSVNTSLFGLNLRIFGLYTPDAIRSYWYQNDAGELVRTYANTNKDYSLGGQIVHFLNWKKIACSSMFNTHYSYRRTAEENVKSALGYLSLNPTYTFKNKMALGATVSYMLYTIYSGMEGSKKTQPCSIGLNLRKKFLKQDCLEVELVCADILHLKQRQRHEVNIDDLQLRQDSRQHCLPLSFRFSWRIGSFQVKPVKRGVRGVLIDDVKQAE